MTVKVKHEGDPEAALVQYTSHGEALSAIRSTEAVLNNRFIKVFWHSKELQQKHEQTFGAKPEEQSEETDANGSSKLSIKDRLGPKVSDTESVVTAVNSSGTISRTVFDPAKLKKNNTLKNAENANSETNNNQTIPDSTNSSSAAKSSPNSENQMRQKQIYSQQFKLLEEMINNQKQLTNKWEKSTNENEKKMIKDTIDVITKRITNITNGIKEMAQKNSAKKPMTKEDIMVAILNSDLDLFMKMQNKDVSYVDAAKEWAKMERLKKQRLMVTRGRGRGMRRGRGMSRRGSFYGRGANPLLKVDRRTRKLLIPEINEDDITDLLEHLAVSVVTLDQKIHCKSILRQ